MTQTTRRRAQPPRRRGKPARQVPQRASKTTARRRNRKEPAGKKFGGLLWQSFLDGFLHRRRR